MGKGLALQFKAAFPDNFSAYREACKAGLVRVGRVFAFERVEAPRWIINFPTKDHWRDPSRLEYIEDGLADLVQCVQKHNIASLALPPLGCGNGGLEWSAVKPVILRALSSLPSATVILFEPSTTPLVALPRTTPKPRMTAARAALLALLDNYLSTGYEYRLSLIEVQKLAYFLQLAGEPLRLDYRAHHYGPYADNLRKALRNMEGHYTRGLGDGNNSPDTPLELLPGAAQEARAFLSHELPSLERMERVAKLIEGFETPFGMELLGTVHWVASNAPLQEFGAITSLVHAWSPRKRSTMKPGHIRAAWERLQAHPWTQPAAPR
jgi:O-acetyl-ADP-ribose deacetylase (regulator of RNase III)